MKMQEKEDWRFGSEIDDKTKNQLFTMNWNYKMGRIGIACE